MKERELYTTASLELHLFFLRIMKEHAIFLAAGFTPANSSLSREALQFRTHFENLLLQAVHLGNAVIRPDVLNSGEIVTEHTLTAEQQTQNFTGILINRRITELELQLTSCQDAAISVEQSQQVKYLNQQVFMLLNKFIRFKQMLIDQVCACRLFTVNYLTMLRHITHEAKHYQQELMKLENENTCDTDSGKPDETFWNHIMMEHALFVRGLLDPCENKLIVTANTFAEQYAELIDRTTEENCGCKDGPSTVKASLEETVKFRKFKETATIGLEKCEIQAIAVPLLADHILREANHYIRILR